MKLSKIMVLLFAFSMLPNAFAVEDFSIVAVPDIQYYTGQGIGIKNITNWILNNSEKENIKMVIFLGDLVDTYAYKDNEAVAWELAREGIWSLNGSVAFMVIPGNHDTNAKYCEYFCVQESENFSQYSIYAKYDFNGTKIGFLGFDFQPTDEEVIEARNIIRNNSEYQWIIFTHSYLSWYSGVPDYVEGRKIKGLFLEQTNNTPLIISGHFDGYFAQLENETFEIVTGHKSSRHPYVGEALDGTIGIYRFKPEENLITGDWFSVNLNKSHSSFNMTYQMTPVYVNITNETTNETFQQEISINSSLAWNFGEPYYLVPPEPEEEPQQVQHYGGGGGGSSSKRKISKEVKPTNISQFAEVDLDEPPKTEPEVLQLPVKEKQSKTRNVLPRLVFAFVVLFCASIFAWNKVQEGKPIENGVQ